MVQALFDKKLRVPVALSFFAPMSVVFCLEVLHSVWWTLAVYQLGICLVIPGLESLLTGKSWRDHARILGLETSSFQPFYPAISLALITAGITAAFLILTRGAFLSAERLGASLSAWGMVPHHSPGLLLAFAMINAPAEELFWRGYLPGRFALPNGRPLQIKILTIALPAVLYTSYHTWTIGRLFGSPVALFIMTGGILAAGLAWGWLRRRTGSVWPALMSHGGAVLAYLGVHFWITQK